MDKSKVEMFAVDANGQYSFNFSIESSHYVVQSNALLRSRQNLNLNSTKIIRAAIMQIEPGDQAFKPYVISIIDLSKLLNVSSSNLYRDIKAIVNNINRNPVEIEAEDSKMFISIPWVQLCAYDPSKGFFIQLNESLRPHLLDLKKRYGQYEYELIRGMDSVYGVRLFELLMSYIMVKIFPKNGMEIILTVDEIRKGCSCMDKYPAFANLKDRVIDPGVREINRLTMYNIKFEYVKKGRSVYAIKFFIDNKINSEYKKLEINGTTNQ